MTGVDDRTRMRIGALAGGVLVMFGILMARLWFLQVLAGEEFAAASKENSVRLIWEEAPRGRILDRNGRVLVKNRTALAVGIRREDFPKGRKGRALKAKLAALLKIPVSQIDRRLADRRTSPYQAAPIAEDVPMTAYFALRERQDEFPGVETLELAVRAYPLGSIAPHVLGYVNEITDEELKKQRNTYRLGDTIGRTGIERQYERWLRGKPGIRKLEVDASGSVLGTLGAVDAVPGKDVQLTIDARVQRVAEQALRDGIARARARRFHETDELFEAPAGAAVVLEAKTGEVVAMASFPTYDIRRFVGGVSEGYYKAVTDEARAFPLFNRASQAAYPPGSTFKPMMAIAALATKTASPSGGYPCKTEYEFGDRIFRNWRARNATISLAQSLIESCDTVYYDFARRWWLREHDAEVENRKPYELMQDWARRFGLGQVTGIDLPAGAEADGRVPDRAWRKAVWEANRSEYCSKSGALFEDLCERGYLWRGGDSVNMSIGQGDVQVTPLQLAVSYAAVANGGSVVTPHIGMKVADPGGKVLHRVAPKPRARVNAPASAFSYVQRALRRVAEDGTARFPFRGWPLDRIPMASKTGSAEIAGKQPFSWFASYGPAARPRYVVVAVVEQAGSGSQVAGPVVRRIMDELFDQPPLPIVFGEASD